jgi:MOSC domain-containing protein YiiM
MVIEHLCLSPGHNYYEHFGHSAGAHPTIQVESLECVAGRGIRGDRFFDYKPDYKGQITFFAMETLEALRQAVNAPQATPVQLRRNVFTRGMDLNALIGRAFEMQGVRFFGVEECRPCLWMNEAIAPGAEEWLRGWGGLRCKILTDGILSISTASERTQTELHVRA